MFSSVMEMSAVIGGLAQMGIIWALWLQQRSLAQGQLSNDATKYELMVKLKERFSEDLLPELRRVTQQLAHIRKHSQMPFLDFQDFSESEEVAKAYDALDDCLALFAILKTPLSLSFKDRLSVYRLCKECEYFASMGLEALTKRVLQLVGGAEAVEVTPAPRWWRRN
jgi:hypothetical protein